MLRGIGGMVATAIVWSACQGPPSDASPADAGTADAPSGSPDAPVVDALMADAGVAADAGSAADAGLPDGAASAPKEWIAYIADEVLYAVDVYPAQPATPIALSPPGARVYSMRWSPDGTKLAYAGRQDPPIEAIELYVVDMSGSQPGSPEKANPPAELGDGVVGNAPHRQGYAWSRDSRWLSFVMNTFEAMDTVGRQYVVDTTSAPLTPYEVSLPLAEGDEIATDPGSYFSPDSDTLVYLARHATDAMHQLWAVDLSGATPGTPQQVNGDLVEGGDVGAGIDGGFAQWRGDRLVYAADLNEEFRFELFMVGMGGASPGPSLRVNGDLVTGGDVTGLHGGGASYWSRDGDHILYFADQESDERYELWHCDTSGPGPGIITRVNAPLADGETIRSNATQEGTYFGFSPDSRWVTYLSDHDTTNMVELYAVDVSSGVASAAVKVNGALTTMAVAGGDGGDVRPFMAWSPDGSRLAFVADQEVDQQFELFLADMSGAVPAAPDKLADGLATSIEFSPDGSLLAFLVNDDTDVLYVVTVDGPAPGTPVMVNDPLPDGANVRDFAWSPDSTRLLYWADPDGPYGLYLAEVTGGNVSSPVQVSANGDRVEKDFYAWQP